MQDTLLHKFIDFIISGKHMIWLSWLLCDSYIIHKYRECFIVDKVCESQACDFCVSYDNKQVIFQGVTISLSTNVLLVAT